MFTAVQGFLRPVLLRHQSKLMTEWLWQMMPETFFLRHDKGRDTCCPRRIVTIGIVGLLYVSFLLCENTLSSLHVSYQCNWVTNCIVRILLSSWKRCPTVIQPEGSLLCSQPPASWILYKPSHLIHLRPILTLPFNLHLRFPRVIERTYVLLSPLCVLHSHPVSQMLCNSQYLHL
jgi:hypothetical protein